MKSSMKLLGDLTVDIKTRKNAIWTNQKTVLLSREWPRTIAKTTEVMKYRRKLPFLVFMFIYFTKKHQLSLPNC